MKQLLYKEFKLALHPTCYIFLAFGLMLLIPAYPYYVAFAYMCLAVFFIFLTGRENNDAVYTAVLPIKKTDVVKARCLTVAVLETAQMAVSVPFAVLGAYINPNAAGNTVGIEANAAFYGLVFVMFAFFNALYLPGVYKDVQKPGKHFVWSFTAVFVYIIIVEALLYIFPSLKAALDTFDKSRLPVQLAVLFGGAVVFAAGMVFTCKKAMRNFAGLDL